MQITNNPLGVPGFHKHLNTGIEGLQGDYMLRQIIAGDRYRRAQTQNAGVDLLETADIVNDKWDPSLFVLFN